MSSHLANFNFCSFSYPRFSLRALHCNCSKGWINDENPLEKASCLAKEGFQTPIDEIDAAARILDPIMVGLRPPQRQQRQRPQPANGGGSERRATATRATRASKSSRRHDRCRPSARSSKTTSSPSGSRSGVNGNTRI